MLQILQTLFSKLGEKLADCCQGAVDYKFTLESLERELSSLRAKALDVKKEMESIEPLGQKDGKEEVKNWLSDIQKLESEFVELVRDTERKGFISRFLYGDQVKRLSIRVDGLVEQSRHFRELDVYKTKGETLLTERLVGKEFEKNLKRIWKFLVVDRVSSIGIFGMGGIGKTTLAKHINNRLLETSEECLWVTVSQGFSVKSLQDEISRVGGILDLSKEHNVEKRAARLNRALTQKRSFVLILDDVWDNINLEKVGVPLSLEGCRLIVTSRSLEVCRQIGCKEFIPVKVLHRNEAWELFSETLGQTTMLTSPVKELARSITNACHGLPLAITATAGNLRGESDIFAWRNMLARLGTPTMGEDDNEAVYLKVIRRSFDRLDQREKDKRKGYTKLQRCFLYCCLYPEDYKIGREELINKFISEELLDEKRSRKRQVDEGHAILNKLVNVCLLERAGEYSTHGGDGVKMHAVVRAMALKIIEGKYKAKGGYTSLIEFPSDEEEHWREDLEKMSLMYNSKWKIPHGMSPNCPKLSILLLQGCHSLNIIPNSFFSQMHGLRIFICQEVVSANCSTLYLTWRARRPCSLKVVDTSHLCPTWESSRH